MTLRRLQKLLKHLPISDGKGLNAARKASRRTRATSPTACEALEQRIVLSRVSLQVSAADDFTVDREAVEVAIADGRTLQPTSEPGRYLVVVDDLVRTILVESFVDLAGDSDASYIKASGEPLNTGDGDSGGGDRLRLASFDLASDAAPLLADDQTGFEYTQDRNLIYRTDVGLLSQPTAESGDSGILDALRATTELPGTNSTLTPQTTGAAATAEESATDDATPLDPTTTTTIDQCGPLNPTVATPDAPAEVFVGPTQQHPAPTPTNAEPEPLQVVINVDPSLSELLSEAELRQIVSEIRLIVRQAYRRGPHSRGFLFSVRTKLRQHRRSSFVATIRPPVAHTLPSQPRVSDQRRPVDPTPTEARLEQQSQSETPETTAARQRQGSRPVHEAHATYRTDTPQPSTAKSDGGNLNTEIRPAPAVLTTVSPQAELTLSETRTTKPTEPTETIGTNSVQGAVESTEVEESLEKIRSVARPEFALATGPSGGDERTTPGLLDVRHFVLSETDAAPVQIDRPLEPAIESPVLQQLEFEQAPRGPPKTDAVATGFEFNRASELRLKMLKHSQAPRSPSVVSVL